MQKFNTLAIVSSFLFISSVAVAQVDISGEPGFGTLELETGFAPDPTSVEVIAGGSEDTASLGDCAAGHIASVPDVRVNYTAGSLPLRFFVDDPESDTTLAINAPDGTWFCVDDAAGLQPIVDFASPLSGQYDIFVGTYSDDEFPTVSLQITELPAQFGPGQAAAPMPSGQTLVGGIDYMGEPTYGTMELESGFTPDPATLSVVAGGTADSSALSGADGNPCNAGQIANAPDARVNFVAGSLPLRFYVDTADTDTTLAINAPDGSWYCIDDAVGLHPVIDFATPLSGQYDVFVGTYTEGEFPSVTLSVTELPGEHGPE